MNDIENKDEVIQKLIIEYFKQRVGISIDTQFFSPRIEIQPVSKMIFPI